MFLETKDGALNLRRVLEVSPVFGNKFFLVFDTGRSKVLVFASGDEARRERERILRAFSRVEPETL